MPATNQLEDNIPACPRSFLDLPIPAVFQLFALAVQGETMALPDILKSRLAISPQNVSNILGVLIGLAHISGFHHYTHQRLGARLAKQNSA